MTESGAIARAFTTHFMRTTLLLALAVGAGLGVTFAFVPRPEEAAAAVQAVVAALAVVIGACWALNRHFVWRADATQLRVDATVDCVPAGEFGSTGRGLLLVRLDLVNTGKVLIRELRHTLEVQTVRPGVSASIQEHLLRVPGDGEAGARIEPGSWAAINFAHPIGPEVRVVWLFLEMRIEKRRWTWHQTFRLPLDSPARPSPAAARSGPPDAA
jgi:hypothetical protein